MIIDEIEKEEIRVSELGRDIGFSGEQGFVWSYYLDKLNRLKQIIKQKAGDLK